MGSPGCVAANGSSLASSACRRGWRPHAGGRRLGLRSSRRSCWAGAWEAPDGIRISAKVQTDCIEAFRDPKGLELIGHSQLA